MVKTPPFLDLPFLQRNVASWESKLHIFGLDVSRQFHTPIGSVIPGESGSLLCPLPISSLPLRLRCSWKPVFPAPSNHPTDQPSLDHLSERAATSYFSIIRGFLRNHGSNVVFATPCTSRKLPQQLDLRVGNSTHNFLARNPEPVRSVLGFLLSYFPDVSSVTFITLFCRFRLYDACNFSFVVLRVRNCHFSARLWRSLCG